MKTIEELGIAPSPWTATNVRLSPMVDDSFGYAVARVYTDDTPNATARLIAAAPELYEVCRKLLAWHNGASGALLDIVKEAKTALAKATGESEVEK